MGDRNPPAKPDEQYPLLKVAGGGDMGHPAPPHAAVAPDWGVTKKCVQWQQAWWRRGARWLAAPALLVTALEAASDAGDAMLAAALRGASEPARVAAQTAAAGVLVTVEILVWYFIAKFFEYNPPLPADENEKENPIRALPE